MRRDHWLKFQFYALAAWIFTGLSSSNAYSKIIFLDGPTFATTWLGPSLDIIETPQSSNPIAAFQNSSTLFHSTNLAPAFGYTHKKYAAKITIKNLSSEAITGEMVFYGPFEHIYYQSQHYLTDETGASKNAFKSSPIIVKGMFHPPTLKEETIFRYPHFHVEILPGYNDLYFAEEAVTPHFPILLFTEKDFNSFYSSQNLKLSAFLAIEIVCALLIFLIALIVRDKLSFLYAASFFSFFLLNLFITGGLRPFLYLNASSSDFPQLSWLDQFIYMNWINWWGACQFFSILFGAKMLRISIFEKSVKGRFLLMGIFAAIMFVITSHFDPVLAINVFGAPYQIVVLTFSFLSYKDFLKGYRPAICSFFGWLIYCASTTLQLLYFHGFMDPSFLTSWGLVIGQLIQFLLLGAAMFWDQKYQVSQALAQLQANFKELERRDQIIMEYSSPRIVSEIAMGLDPRLYKSRWEEIAIFFTDIRDFTSLVESTDLTIVEEILNNYMGTIIDHTFDFQGEVNKMIGDAVMSLFNTPQDCLNACLAIRKSVIAINRLRVKANLEPVKMGIGASYSKVISLNIGRKGKKLDRTVIGDEVNIAARMESLTKDLRVDVLVSQRFHEKISDYEFQRPVGTYHLKGKKVNTSVFEVFGHTEGKVLEFKLASKPKLEHVFDLWNSSTNPENRIKNLSESEAIIRELIANCPEHNYLKGKPLDRTLEVILNNILEEKEKL